MIVGTPKSWSPMSVLLVEFDCRWYSFHTLKLVEQSFSNCGILEGLQLNYINFMFAVLLRKI